MASELKWMPLEDCLDALIDYRGKTPVKTASGVPLITARVVKGGTIERPTEFIAHEAYSAWMRRGMPRAGDVLLTTEAPLGEVAQLQSAHVALAQRIILLRGKSGFLDNGYLKYFFLTDEGRRGLEARASGTTVLGIKQSELRRVEIPIVPFEEQAEIAHTLQSLDDKIALLRETNATLEAIAQALFKSWFVDFDPVRAKAEGRDPEGVPPEVADLFPSEFEDSEQGLIPKGWRVGSLKDMTEKVGSGSTPRGGKDVYVAEGIAFVRSQNVYDSEFIWDGLARITPTQAEGLSYVELHRGDVLLNITGASILRTCVVDPGVLPARVNQHVAIIRAKTGVPGRFLHQQLLRKSTKEFLMGMNAGASREAVTKAHIESVPLLVPPQSILGYFQAFTEPSFSRIENNATEIRTLIDIRDTLLPRLMSGKLSCSHIAT